MDNSTIPGTERAILREHMLLAALRQTEGIHGVSMFPAQVMTLAKMLEDYVLTGKIPEDPKQGAPKS